MQDVVIVAAKRTAIGAFGGSLSAIPAHKLGAHVIKSVIDEVGIDPSEVSEVILGQVLTAGEGQNPARQASIKAGIPDSKPAFLINQVCGSGLRAVALGFQSVQLGDNQVVIAGGQENMSLSTHAACYRNPYKMGDIKMTDTMISDGLWDAFHNYHMGQTAENLAEKWNISREEQDLFSYESQMKAAYAQENGYFQDQITPLSISTKKEEFIFSKDEYIRPETSLESLAKLRPAFMKDGGTVTAGNASGLNDGAVALMLMSYKTANKLGITPLARIVSWASCGVAPAFMGTGPIPSSQLALSKASWLSEDLDLIEANEAFAAQAITVNKEMGWDSTKVNVNGGAIALGHPIGASGARILVTLLHEMKRQKKKKGLATLCVGGGMGVSLCIERE